jgi:hypothetical protein
MNWDNLFLQVVVALFLLVGGVGGWWYVIERAVDA